MAVYTPLNETEVADFLRRFGLVRLVQLQATSSGIENTNYFVDAEDSGGQCHPLVLTLFERGDPQSLPYFVELTRYLGLRGLPVPAPWLDVRQQALQQLKSRTCLLVPRFSGQHPRHPTPGQCMAIGSALAEMHLASPGFAPRRDNDRGILWRQQLTARLLPLLPPDQAALLQEQVDDWQRQLPALAQLPSGITHGDLFHDNALFDGDRLTGIIDFYNACHDLFIYDLAVLVNDWCCTADFGLDPARLLAVLRGYEGVRRLSEQERPFWPAMLRFAALRFWLSRLESRHFPAPGSAAGQKDPEPMRCLLLHHRDG